MTIYARTENGQALAFSAASGLPYKQRAILKVIDGKTSLGVFEDSLRAFGDVRGVFEALVIAGLIKPLPDESHRIRPREADGMEAHSTSSMEPHNAHQWFETRVGDGESSHMPTLAMHSQMGPETIAVPYAAPSELKLQEQRKLQRVIELIDVFVRAQLPAEAPQVLEKLDEITSLELFVLSLKGYEQMIVPLGRLAEAHIAQIKDILHSLD